MDANDLKRNYYALLISIVTKKTSRQALIVMELTEGNPKSREDNES